MVSDVVNLHPYTVLCAASPTCANVACANAADPQPAADDEETPDGESDDETPEDTAQAPTPSAGGGPESSPASGVQHNQPAICDTSQTDTPIILFAHTNSVSVYLPG